MFQQKCSSFNPNKSLRNNTIIAENRMNKGFGRNCMLLKSFRVYCINCVRDAEAVGSSPVASTRKASIERCSLFLSRKRPNPRPQVPNAGDISKNLGAEVVGCGGPVDHSGLEEPRSTDRAGRRDRVPSPRQKNCLFRGFFVLIFKRDLIW